MIVELGHFALALALALALLQSSLPVVGAWRRDSAWMALAPRAARAQFLFVVLAFCALGYAFARNDFTLAYVAANSNSSLPLAYRLSALWGAHEGSLLLWVLILAAWGAAVARYARALPAAFVARVLGVLGVLASGFLLFLLLTSNPFLRELPPAADGADLNPLLQDPGLVIHPPMLYAGYVGFAVPFAFAMAGLLGGQIDSAWARWARPWTLAAWAFLTVGIALGSWWAYYELGWGGWWFWDPVENASFMPWLLGTALIHSLAVSEKRETFKSWTVLLAIGTFALSLLGTFLVRSGVLTSVHAFASDPARGVFVLALLAVVVGGALALYAWRNRALAPASAYTLTSRETFLLANSVLLGVATATILLGTLYPLALDAFGLGKISVGPPYFNSVFVPVMAALATLLGLGQHARWKRDRFTRLCREVGSVSVVAVVCGLAALAMFGAAPRPAAALGVTLAVWIAASSLTGIVQRCRGRGSAWQAWNALPASYRGQMLAHCGFAITLTGVALVSTGSAELHTRIAPGDAVEVAGYSFRFERLAPLTGPNYHGHAAHFSVTKGDRRVAELEAQKRYYKVRKMAMTEAGIDPGLTRDLYVALGEPLGDGAWSVRLSVKPFIRWLWLGALLMAGGGVLALGDRRLRRVVARKLPVGQTALG